MVPSVSYLMALTMGLLRSWRWMEVKLISDNLGRIRSQMEKEFLKNLKCSQRNRPQNHQGQEDQVIYHGRGPGGHGWTNLTNSSTSPGWTRYIPYVHCSIYPKSIPYIRKILLYESPFRLGPAKNGPYSRKFHISEFLVSGIGCIGQG